MAGLAAGCWLLARNRTHSVKRGVEKQEDRKTREQGGGRTFERILSSYFIIPFLFMRIYRYI